VEEIRRMQENLLLIRRAVGWTAEEFGEQIGVTRQTINNIESGRNKLTKTQYIAMRSVLDAEMAKHPEDTKMLRVLLDALVDRPEKYTDQERNELLKQANLLTPSILAGSATREEVSNEWMKTAMLAGSVASALISSVVAAGPWLVKIIAGKDNKK
jgi:transcriptional regulator with XRE-family HTH domain